MRLMYMLEVVALGLWTGAAVGFGLMAPVLFHILPSRQMAGTVAGMAIARIETLGLAAGLVALWALATRRRAEPTRSRRYRFLAVLAMVALIALDAGPVRRQLDRIQARMDRPIDEYAVTDPIRAEYRRWHGISMGVGSLATLLGVVALAWAAAAPPAAGPGAVPADARRGTPGSGEAN